MGRLGKILGIKASKSRPIHNSIEEAKKHYYKFRDIAFNDINNLRQKYPDRKLDYSPESLKDIESLYFYFLENNKYTSEFTIARMEELLAVYYGEVYVQNTKTSWSVEEDPYISNRYYLAVKFDNGFMTIECKRKTNHNLMKDNKRKQSLYREFKKHENFT